MWMRSLPCECDQRPALVAEWLTHLAAMCSRAWHAQWPGFDSVYQRILSNNSYAHDEQGVNPGQVRGFDGVLCKLWPLLMPWLAASRYQPHWREPMPIDVANPLLALNKCKSGLALHKRQLGLSQTVGNAYRGLRHAIEIPDKLFTPT